MDNTAKKLHSTLKLLFAGAIIISVLAFMLVVAYTTKYDISSPSVILERYAIVITLIGIPLSLKLFHDKLKKTDASDTQLYMQKYRLYYLLRMGALLFIYLFNTVSLYITGSKNFYFMVIITIFAFFLCAPQKVYIDTDNNEEQETI